MVAAVLLGLLQLAKVSESDQQLANIRAKMQTMSSENARLQQQVKGLTHINKPQPVIHTKKNTGYTYQKGLSQDNLAGALVTVVIDPGLSIAQIANILKNAGIIPSTQSFVIAAIKYNQTLRAGKFSFHVNESYSRILYIMATN